MIPVALADNQRPPRPLSNRAAFSVAATSLSYRLRPNQTAEVGAVFTRDALARLWPTYSRRRLRLFLSHRRADGADLVRQLASALSDLNHRPLRDQTFVRPGRDIGASVAQTLNQADVFVLCDTPAAAGEHAWLKDELCVALGLGIPIVWVRFGQIGCRSELEIRPADEPDLDENWPTDDQSFHEVADRILDRSLIAGGIKFVELNRASLERDRPWGSRCSTRNDGSCC